MKNKKILIPTLTASILGSLAPTIVLASCGEQNHVVTPTQEQKTAEPIKGSKEAVYSIELLDEATASDMKVEAEVVSNNVTLTGSVVKVENKVLTFKTTLSNAKNVGDIDINFNVKLSNSKSGWNQTINGYVFKFKAANLTAIELNEHEDIEYGLEVTDSPITIKSTTPEESKIKSIKYESLDPAIIAITDETKGSMKAITGAGTARIKLTATDANGAVASNTVDVKAKNTAATSLTISGSHNIDKDDMITTQFSAIDNYGRDQTKYIEWSVEDEKGATSSLAYFDGFDKGLLTLSDDGRAFGGSIVIKAKYNNKIVQTYKADIGSYSMMDIESAKNGIVKAKDKTISGLFIMPNNYYDENGNAINLYNIPADAFKDCTALTDFRFSKSLTSLDVDMFNGCTALDQLSVDDENTLYGAEHSCLYAKQDIEGSYDKGTLIVGAIRSKMPDDAEITQIGPKAFRNVQFNNTSFKLSSSITKIGDNAFESTNISNLSIEASKDVTIGNAAFKNCTSLATVTATGLDYLSSIGQQAFLGCTALTAITIPATCKFIGAQAFEGCNNANLIIKFVADSSTGTTFMPYWSFIDDNDKDCLWQPSDAEDDKTNTILLTGDDYQDNDKTSIGNILNAHAGSDMAIITATSSFNENYFELPDYFICRYDDSSVKRYPITSIADNAFKDKTCLLGVDLKNADLTLTTIGANAFSGCSNLTAFRIGVNVKLANVGTDAFTFNNTGIARFELFIDSSEIANATTICEGLYGNYSKFVYTHFDLGQLSDNCYLKTCGRYTIGTSPHKNYYVWLAKY